MSHDTILHRILRPMVRKLVGGRITPDALTAARLATGLTAAACFAAGPPLMGAGAGLFLLSTLLDRADGELARQSRRVSRFGQKLDVAADCLSNMAIFIGLGLGAAESGPLGPVLGLSAAFSTVALFAGLDLLTPAGIPAHNTTRSRPFDPDDAMLLVPVAIWCGGASWILLAAGVLTPLAALGVMSTRQLRRRMRRADITT